MAKQSSLLQSTTIHRMDFHKSMMSVIIPAYNAGKTIAKALDSIYAQNCRPLEVIVVDDGSVDETREVIKNYSPSIEALQGGNSGKILDFRASETEEQLRQTQQSSDSEKSSYRTVKTTYPGESVDLIYICQANGGPSKARNTGIRAARGDCVAFLDADDQWIPEKMAKQVSFLQLHPEVALVFSDMRIVSDNGDVVESAFKKYGYHPHDENGLVYEPFTKLLVCNFIPTSTVVARRKCFEQVGYFDETIRHGEDYDLWLRIALRFGVGCVPEVLEIKYNHAGNLSQQEHKFYDSKIHIIRKLQREHGTYLGDAGIPLQEHLLATMREYAYFWYVERRYGSASVKLISYLFQRMKLLAGGSIN
jgi:glycosyltransferase involved in cell wall biosynthesis